MQWESTGFILSVKKHGESSAIIDVFTPDKGRHLGLVRGGVGRRMRPILQIGNKIEMSWRGRLSEHLGHFTVEPVELYASHLMQDRLSLAGLNAICTMAKNTLPEREAYSDLFSAFEVVIAHLHDPDIWPKLYVKWEAGLLARMGYGLDLRACAATGVEQNLTHVSPRSGRAVSDPAAAPYIDKLFALPAFLGGHAAPQDDDVLNGLRLTGYFLETRLSWATGQTLPEARRRLMELFET